MNRFPATTACRKWRSMTARLLMMWGCVVWGGPDPREGGEFPLLLEVGRDRNMRVVLSLDIIDAELAAKTHLVFPAQRADIATYLTSIGEQCVVVRPGVLSNHPPRTFGEITSGTQLYLDALRRSIARQPVAEASIDIRNAPVGKVFDMIGVFVGASFNSSAVRGDVAWITTVRPMPMQEWVVTLEALCALGNYGLESTNAHHVTVIRTGPVWRQFVVTSIQGERRIAADATAMPQVRWVKRELTSSERATVGRARLDIDK